MWCSAMVEPGSIVVALKRSLHVVGLDPLSGVAELDDKVVELSAAEASALELAVQLGEGLHLPVAVVSVGGALAEPVLRLGLAGGATRALRVEVAGRDQRQLSSAAVAAALAAVARKASMLLCGDHSLDRASGAVPAMVGAALGWPTAASVTAVRRGPDGLEADRRLGRGRLETVRIDGPAVVSVEPTVARPRRASLRATLEANAAVVAVVEVLVGDEVREVVELPTEPPRPRAKVVPPPDPTLSLLDRISALTGATQPAAAAERVTLEPAAAAALIAERLSQWGYW